MITSIKFLRPGNLIGVPELGLTAGTVENFLPRSGIVTFKESQYYSHYEQLNPIDLTEDFLIKNGFVNKGANDSAKSDWKKENTYCPSFCLDEGAFYCTNECGVDWFAYCDFVHQFQNAYFVLTGEELEVKL